MDSGTLPNDLTMYSGFVYYFSSLTVPIEYSLTIQAGTVLKLTNRLTIENNLITQGTASDKVYITSYKDDSVGGDTNGDGEVQCLLQETGTTFEWRMERVRLLIIPSFGMEDIVVTRTMAASRWITMGLGADEILKFRIRNGGGRGK